MGARGVGRRLLVGLTVLMLLGGCGASATPTPSTATPTPAPTTATTPTPTPTPAVTAAVATPALAQTPTPVSSPGGSMTDTRAYGTATLLADGRVLLAGGRGSTKEGNTILLNAVLASAELYEPKTGTFSPTGSMAAARWGHTATLLGDGRVLIAGGADTRTTVSLPPSCTTRRPACSAPPAR